MIPYEDAATLCILLPGRESKKVSVTGLGKQQEQTSQISQIGAYLVRLVSTPFNIHHFFNKAFQCYLSKVGISQ